MWQYSYNTQSGGGGTLASSIDPKGTQTTYSYVASCSGQSNSCNGAFPTQVSTAGLCTSYAYNCNGGVVTAVTDPNGATTSTNYTDPYYWRPASILDPAGYETDFTYYTNVNGSGSLGAESVLKSNGSPVVDKLTVEDAFGRLSLNQTREQPGSGLSGIWDTVEYLYDANGRTGYTTLPFAGTAGAAAGSVPSTGYFYDALNRYTEISTFDGVNRLSYTDYVYNQNDVKMTVSPAPPGEQPKSRQYEYDALGRLTSVCELTSAQNGGVACQQHTGQTGFFTGYTYDSLGDLTSVNQSGQGRWYSYDGLGRMI